MTMSATTTHIAERLERLRENVQRAAASAGRDLQAITLVAVTKTHSAATVEAAYNIGLRHFGENRVEEAGEKIPALDSHPDIVWHMVGHMQSRKAQDVVTLFSRVHSIDRLKIARRLSAAAAEQGRTLDGLLEVNLSGEESKYGLNLSGWPEDTQQTAAFLDEVKGILALPNLRVDGLMTMAPFTDQPETVRPVFTRLAKVRDALAKRFPEVTWKHLSMGMSGDYEVAVQEGATMIRVGTALFGPRGT